MKRLIGLMRRIFNRNMEHQNKDFATNLDIIPVKLSAFFRLMLQS